ncbi:hypothetical protein FACS1894179_06860 [Bacteroidia bacterium]|nr:hypothetical protein FACS1894179_06860 [Bacteroidia bacterium]
MGVAVLLQILFKMTSKKNDTLNLTVIDGLQVKVLPDTGYEFLMTTKEVATGYGTTIYAINMARIRHESELIEGKHYLTAITKCYSGLNLPHNAILWTKRGIVRLGFFIKSERAKLFRDWAEELILTTSPSPSQRGEIVKALPTKRNHNRLTSERLVKLLTLTNRIDNSELRNEIVNELTGGHSYGNF